MVTFAKLAVLSKVDLYHQYIFLFLRSRQGVGDTAASAMASRIKELTKPDYDIVQLSMIAMTVKAVMSTTSHVRYVCVYSRWFFRFQE